MGQQLGKCRVKNRHLKNRNGWWHYRRRVPGDVAAEVGKITVDLALKTKDVIEARRRRDKYDAGLERSWQQVREKAKRVMTSPLADDEEARAYALYVDNPEEADLVASLYLDEVDDLAAKRATGPRGEDLVEAKELLGETPEGKRLARLINAAQGNISLAAAGEKFLDQARLSLGAKRLYRGVYAVANDRFLHPKHVTKQQAREFIQEMARDASLSKIVNYRAALRALWDHLGLDKTIWSGFRVDAGREAIERDIWTDEEIGKLLRASSPKLRLATLIAALVGARQQEIATMVYDAEQDIIVFPKSKTKAGLRTIPCPDDAREFVKSWVADPWSHFTIRNRFSELKTELGFPETKVFHSFRHLFASRLHEAGVQEATAAQILGHKHEKLTYGWYGNKVNVETLRRPINMVRYPATLLALGR